MKIRTIADAAIVAAMLMISVPSLADELVQSEAAPPAVIAQAPAELDGDDEAAL